MVRHLDVRRDVLETSLKLLQDGYFGTGSGTGGNVSARIEGEPLIAITPTGKPYPDLKPDDICLMDMGGRKVEGSYEPSVETGFHLEIYRQREDAGAVVHTHQPYASVFALLNEPIPALFDEVVFQIGDRVPVVPYALSGSPELVKNVSDCLGSRCNCYILQNHGALSLGADLARALKHAHLLEKAARVYYMALCTGKKITPLPDDIVSGLMSVVRLVQDQEAARRKSRLQPETPGG